MEKVIKNRITILVLLVVVMASAIGAKLYVLQVVRTDTLLAQAQSQHAQQRTVPATRGTILDRNRRELAVSIATQSLYAHPRRLENPRHFAELLAPVLGVSDPDRSDPAAVATDSRFTRR